MSEIERMREAVRRFEMAHEALLDAIDSIPAGAMKLVAASTGTARYWLDDAIQTIASELRKAERAALRSKTGHADTHPLGGRRADHEVVDGDDGGYGDGDGDGHGDGWSSGPGEREGDE